MMAEDHFDGERYFNPGISVEKTFGDMLRWRRSRQPVPWPEQVENSRFPPPPTTVPADTIGVTYIGQATLLLQFPGLNVITDPIFSERAGPFSWLGPRRVRPPAVALNDLPPIDLVLLSHNHYDHMDLPSLRALSKRWRPAIVTGLGNGRYLAGKGIDNSIELDWWDSWEAGSGSGARVTYVPAQHWSSRSLSDRRRMLWGGHVVETLAGRVYFAGDTGYPGHFQAIRERLGPPDIALLPIGAYEPRWFMAAQHIDPDEAVKAHLDLQAKLSIAMHFATFHLVDEAMDAPAQALAKARQEHGVPDEAFVVPDFGRTMLWRR